MYFFNVKSKQLKFIKVNLYIYFNSIILSFRFLDKDQ